MNLPEKLIFRNASEEDVKYIVSIAYSETNKYLERAYNGVFDWEKWESELRKDIYEQNYGNKLKNTSKINKFTKVMVIEALEKPIGFIWFSYYSSDIIWLDSIIIDPNHQAKGYGKQIIDHLVSIFKNDFKYLDLGVQEDNLRAIKFYENLEFYQIDDIAMNYNLTNRMRKNLLD